MQRCGRRFAGLLLAAGLAAGLPGASAAGTACQSNAERRIVSALMNVETRRAIIQSKSLDLEKALIPSSEFYIALANWYRAYQEQNAAEKSVAIDALGDALSALEQTARTSPGADNAMAAGIAGGHVARILFEDSQYLSAYRVAQRARKRLQKILIEAKPGRLGMADVRLLEGLFELYSYDLRQRASWLPRSFSYQGNRDRGIRLVEQAISEGAVFRDDAIRALLAEVPWRTPDFCGYVDLIDSAGERLPDNQDIAIVRQGLMLKCGYPARARQVNQYYLSRHPEDASWRFLSRARLRILANVGDAADLESIIPGASDIDHHRLALANAYDINNRRDDALRIYRSLSASINVDVAVRTVAGVRIKHPFRAPERDRISQFESGTTALCE